MFVCKKCQEHVGALIPHLIEEHQMNADDYEEIYGIVIGTCEGCGSSIKETQCFWDPEESQIKHAVEMNPNDMNLGQYVCGQVLFH